MQSPITDITLTETAFSLILLICKIGNQVFRGYIFLIAHRTWEPLSSLVPAGPGAWGELPGQLSPIQAVGCGAVLRSQRP